MVRLGLKPRFGEAVEMLASSSAPQRMPAGVRALVERLIHSLPGLESERHCERGMVQLHRAWGNAQPWGGVQTDAGQTHNTTPSLPACCLLLFREPRIQWPLISVITSLTSLSDPPR